MHVTVSFGCDCHCCGRFGHVIERLERLSGSSSSSLVPPLQTLPAQPIGKVYNPFAVSLLDSHLATVRSKAACSSRVHCVVQLVGMYRISAPAPVGPASGPLLEVRPRSGSGQNYGRIWPDLGLTFSKTYPPKSPKNSHRRQPPMSFDAPAQGNTHEYLHAMSLIFPETRVIGLHFFR